MYQEELPVLINRHVSSRKVGSSCRCKPRASRKVPPRKADVFRTSTVSTVPPLVTHPEKGHARHRPRVRTGRVTQINAFLGRMVHDPLSRSGFSSRTPPWSPHPRIAGCPASGKLPDDPNLGRGFIIYIYIIWFIIYICNGFIQRTY